jgi:serine/threonine protein kinase
MGSVCSLYDSAPIPVGNKSHYSSGLVKAPLTLHDFERLHVLGEGGFGITHKARNKVTGQIVALKLIKKQQAGMRPGDIRGIFEREVDVLGGLAHMHICHLLEAFEERDCFVLVLEYLRGGELFDRILKLSHYSEKVASEMVQQILNAVSYLHDQKIAHLDIKPENFVCDLSLICS